VEGTEVQASFCLEQGESTSAPVLFCSFAFASDLSSDAESKHDSATRSDGILPYRWEYAIST
jgi:hypothetical protein